MKTLRAILGLVMLEGYFSFLFTRIGVILIGLEVVKEPNYGIEE